LVLDARTRERIRTVRARSEPVFDLEFSRDGRFLALAEPGDVELVDLRDGSVRQLGAALRRRERPALAELGEVHALTFTPDGDQLLAGSVFGLIHRWDVRKEQALSALAADPSGVADLAFSSTGLLAVVTLDGAVRLGPPTSTMLSSAPVVTGAGVFAEAAFTDLDRLLAVAGADGTVRLVDVPSREPVGRPAIVALADMPVGVAAMSNPAGVLLGSSDGQVKRMSVNGADWAHAACAKAGRNLSRQEWQQYVRGPYRRTCARWPAG
jgi:WD40 repeat protein